MESVERLPGREEESVAENFQNSEGLESARSVAAPKVSVSEIIAAEVVRPAACEFSLSAVWSDVLKLLEDRLDNRIVGGWLKPLLVSRIDRSSQHAKIVLRTPNRFVAEHVHHHYRTALTQAFCTALQLPSVTVDLEISAGEALQAGGIASSILQKKAPVTRASSPSKQSFESNLNPRYNFSNFVIGSCNQFAHAAALQVAENLGSTYNPMFIYGGVGLGKTHLVNAIGNASIRRGKQVLMVSSESFVNELISALRSNRMQDFKTKFRSLDLLIIDDVQFMIGKERTQEEFFHTFNELHQRHKQIILTSDKLPQELTGLEERLRTRFSSGLSADLQPPDFETRVAILIKKAESTNIHLDREVAGLVADRVSTNIRELEGALTRLLALSSLKNAPISLSLAEEAVRGYSPRSKPDVTTEYIQRTIAERYGVSISDLLGKRRTQNIANTRQIAMYLCRRLTGCSYPEIGALFGGRDHSTVIHAFRVIDERIQVEERFRAEIDALISELDG
jgi:chromosomal replication initiator protein